MADAAVQESRELSEEQRPAPGGSPDLLPVRMLNESVYCPRLFYLMHVMGEWAPSVDTVEGKHLHRRVDSKEEAFPEADQRDPDDPRVRARSIMLSSERLGIIARMDVVEHAGNEATPVDYKHGAPPRIPERAWLPERVQLCAQGLILEEHGWWCESGVLYFPQIRERVEIPLDEALRAITVEAIANARKIEQRTALPPPLVDSPKCPRCSLAGICLPDETNLLTAEAAGADTQAGRPRRLVPAGDDALPLHLCDQGSRVGVTSQRLEVRTRDGETTTVRLKDISQVNLLGNVQISTQAVRRLLGEGINIGFFSSGGWFYGMCTAIGHSAAALRRSQYARAADPEWSLQLARQLVRSKIRSCRILLRRNHPDPASETLERLRELSAEAENAASSEVLLGIEGMAARIYFANLGGMLKPKSNGQEGGDLSRFDFAGRNRRPPRDPVNAMLSLGYSLLVRHLTAACAVVGLDPHLGFYHRDRPGRPSLALDLMEPFRPILADSAVITAVNNNEVEPGDFLQVGDACSLTPDGRRRFIRSLERRLDQQVRHPVFGYRISYRRVLEVQARLLARHILGELDSLPAFETR